MCLVRRWSHYVTRRLNLQWQSACVCTWPLKHTPHHVYYCWTEQTSTHIFITPITIQNEKTVKIKTLTQWRSRQRHHSIIWERTRLKLHILTARLHLHPTLKNTTEHLKQHHLKLRGSSARFQMIKNIITAITKLILNKYESEFNFNRRSGIKIFFWCSFHVLKTCDSTAETWHIFSVLHLYLHNLRPRDTKLKQNSCKQREVDTFTSLKTRTARD